MSRRMNKGRLVLVGLALVLISACSPKESDEANASPFRPQPTGPAAEEAKDLFEQLKDREGIRDKEAPGDAIWADQNSLLLSPSFKAASVLLTVQVSGKRYTSRYQLYKLNGWEVMCGSQKSPTGWSPWSTVMPGGETVGHYVRRTGRCPLPGDVPG